ncbi:hypothetical protein BSKO_04554 [Bryopsis sp. KO-2023]|nr:hypothetical protein BSKO_04554 [Bryopsis sp. KO-2023]
MARVPTGKGREKEASIEARDLSNWAKRSFSFPIQVLVSCGASRAAPRSNSETPMQIAARLGHVAVIETDNPPTQLEESAKRSLAKRKRRNESWDAVEGEKIVTDEVLTSRPDILSEVEFTKDIEIKVGTQKMLLPVAAVQDVLKSKMREMVEEARAKHG